MSDGLDLFLGETVSQVASETYFDTVHFKYEQYIITPFGAAGFIVMCSNAGYLNAVDFA